MYIHKLTGSRAKSFENKNKIPPHRLFYNLSVILNNGNELKFDSFRGKKVLLVNTASDCGYTGQYDSLQKLYSENQDKLVVIGFPSNDFKEQEKGTDEEIASFCKINFGVSFPLAKKSTVRKGKQQNPVFQWLTHSAENGWCNKQPSWNFSKWLVNEKGILTNYFDPGVSPLSEKLMKAVNNQGF